jgi:hypothetical protein
MASFYNFVRPDQEPEKVFPAGTYLAVPQPFLKFPRDLPMNPPILRSDHPQGVIIFRSKEAWLKAQNKSTSEQSSAAAAAAYGTGVPSAAASSASSSIADVAKQVERARKAGQEAVKQQHYEDALDIYTDALDIVGLDTPSRILFLSNRSQCYIWLEIGELVRFSVWKCLGFCVSAHVVSTCFFFDVCSIHILNFRRALMLRKRCLSSGHFKLKILTLTSNQMRLIARSQFDWSRLCCWRNTQSKPRKNSNLQLQVRTTSLHVDRHLYHHQVFVFLSDSFFILFDTVCL